jgi:hypothetical protein
MWRGVPFAAGSRFVSTARRQRGDLHEGARAPRSCAVSACDENPFLWFVPPRVRTMRTLSRESVTGVTDPQLAIRGHAERLKRHKLSSAWRRPGGHPCAAASRIAAVERDCTTGRQAEAPGRLAAHEPHAAWYVLRKARNGALARCVMKRHPKAAFAIGFLT